MLFARRLKGTSPANYAYILSRLHIKRIDMTSENLLCITKHSKNVVNKQTLSNRLVFLPEVHGDLLPLSAASARDRALILSEAKQVVDRCYYSLVLRSPKKRCPPLRQTSILLCYSSFGSISSFSALINHSLYLSVNSFWAFSVLVCLIASFRSLYSHFYLIRFNYMPQSRQYFCNIY
jgi:hypothetical protein